ncbi:MAG: lysophospholipid acyltransferase family protein [Clostridiaceae bacterium]|nr:lysophospholipid acyltransferase family protein [Clostridiaceae bacterium]
MKRNSLSEKFDMTKSPIRQRWYLRPLTWAGSFPEIWARHLRIDRHGVDDLKPPYLLLCTHMSFMDFKVTTAAIFPHRANYVVAIDGFIGREWLLRNAGAICKRKFTNDITLIRQIKRVIERGDILALYPEARYSLAGTTAVLPDSLGKLVRILGVPVAVLNMHGNYLNSPCWNLKKRKIPIAADFTKILTAEETRNLGVDEINNRIRKAFVYDEYKWQIENKICIRCKDYAKGLHKVLYQCPHCKTEFQMDSAGDKLWCNHCKKEWTLTELGNLKAVNGETEFEHIPDWYEFQRLEVRQQIEAGTYEVNDEVDVDALPNAKGYINLGRGRLTHNLEGFKLDVRNGLLKLEKTPASMYSCHIEYNYDLRGDCIDLSTLMDTYYIYPMSLHCCVTKIALATEELFSFHQRQAARPV